MRIAHISDIHWRGMNRHVEYTRAISQLVLQLKTQDIQLIVCTGDIFHTKTQNITPEVIDKMVWMFKELSSVAPLHMILGNHDGNLTNEDRLEVITPIVEALDTPNVRLYKKSGCYQLPAYRICFGVFSCFDTDGWEAVKPVQDGTVNIALFHGSVAGCVTDGMWRLKHGEMTVESFYGWDIAMLGDIHKQQFLGHKVLNSAPTKDPVPWIGYPGSLIQQNYGEDESKGYLIWDIQTKDCWSVEFCELKNMAPFITVPWLNTVEATVSQLGGRDLRNARVRVVSNSPISRLENKQLHQLLCRNRGAEEVVTKIDGVADTNTVDLNGVSVRKTSLRNDPSSLKRLYREYVKANSDKFSLSTQQLLTAEDTMVSYLSRLGQTEDGCTRDVTWSIKAMEFDNLYRYGEGNRIDFQKLGGIVGILGPNKIGKSSAIGSLMFGLYNTTDRGPIKSSYIINKSKTTGKSQVLFTVNNKDYLAVRKVEKAVAKRKGVVDEEKAATTLNLYRMEQSGSLTDLSVTTSENGDSRSDTDKVIRNLIGSSTDFLLTAFSNQGGINKFIDEGATERKSILNRFLDLDVFEKLYKMANEDRTLLNAKMSKFEPVVWEAVHTQTKRRIHEKENKIEHVRKQIDSLKAQLDDAKDWLREHQTSNVEEMILAKSSLVKEVATLDKQLKQNQARKKKLESEISEQTLLHSKMLDDIAEVDPKLLERKQEAFKTLKSELAKAENTFEKEKTKLAQQTKNVRKLEVVPCGDSYPQCHYIKDAHEDKALLSSQQLHVENLLTVFNELAEEFKLLESEQVDKKLREYQDNTNKAVSLSSSISSCKRELALISENEVVLTKTLETKTEQLSQIESRINLLQGEEYTNRQKELSTLTVQLAEAEGKLLTMHMEIGADRNKLLTLEKEKEDAVKWNYEFKVIDSVAQSLSKQGIPAMVLKTQLPAINVELEKILSGIVDFRVTLETEVNSNTLDVFIEDSHSRRVIELASGMEKMLSSMAIRVALINLSSLPKPDIFIIDEGFGTLDEEGIQKCMQLLTLLKSYFRVVIVISHIPQIKEVADSIIEIKNEGFDSSVVA